MKKNKNIIIVILLLLVILLIISLIIIGVDKDIIFKANYNVVSSLNAQTQEEVDVLIKSDLQKNKYTLSNAKVYVNPYGASPLSALIIFYTEKNVSVEVTIKGKNENDLILNFEESKEHYIPVYGLYENYDNQINIKLSNGENKNIYIKTNGMEENVNATVTNANREVVAKDALYLFTDPLTMSSFGYDSFGDLRWYTTDYYYHDIVKLDNGHFLVGTDSFNAEGLSNQILEIDYLGRIYNEYIIEEGYLNDIYLKEDGNIIAASQKENRDTYSDYIIEVDSNTGKIVKSWDVRGLLESIDDSLMDTSKIEYFYNSGIEYNQIEDSLTLTYWGGEFVINLSYSKGTINWIFSNPDNFSSAFDKYLLKLPSDVSYPKGMHSATVNNGVLKVFDNGFSTNNEEMIYANLNNPYSSANTYKIDGTNISLINSIDEDKKYFSYALGDYSILDDNHEIVLFARNLNNISSKPESNLNDWEDLTSILIERKDNNVILEMSFKGSSYKVSKSKLDGTNGFDFALPKHYSTLLPSEPKEISKDIFSKIKNSTEIIDYNIGYSNGLVEVGRIYMPEEKADLILINEDEEATMYSLKVSGKDLNEKILTDIEPGKYYVYIYENEKMYKTNKYIEIK